MQPPRDDNPEPTQDSENHAAASGVRRPVASRELAFKCLFWVAAFWAAVRIPFMVGAALDRFALLLGSMDTGDRTRDEIILATTGVSAEDLAMLRGHLSKEGRIVIYGDLNTVDAKERLGAEYLLHIQYQTLKNLLYPQPRDGQIARNPEELQRLLDPRLANDLVIAEFTLSKSPLPTAAPLSLLFERQGKFLLRYWLLESAR